MNGRIHPVSMPRWGMTMTEGTVVGWLAEAGAPVAPGDELVEIETTKVVNALEATAGGVLHCRLVDPGATVPVGTLLGIIVEGGPSDAEIDAFVTGFAATAAAEADDAGGTPAPQRLDVGGRTVNVLAMGSGGAAPALLVHGFGGAIDGWRFNQPALADERVVWALDLPGHGESTTDAGDGSVAALSQVVSGTLDALGIGRVHLTGHSLGGALALAMLAAAPGRVASLSLIAPCGLGAEIDGGFVEAFLAAERRKPMKQALSRLFADPAAVRRQMVEDMLKRQRMDGGPEARRTIARTCFPGGRQRTVLRHTLTAATVPVQVLWGRADSIVPPAHADGLPPAVAVHRVDGAGHMPHVEQAGAVNRRLLDFMRAAESA